MLGSNLHKTMRDFESWCDDHDLLSSMVLDHPGFCGIKIFTPDKNKVNQFDDYIKNHGDYNELHISKRKVRGGWVYSFSYRALSESELNILYRAIEENNNAMSFQDKITAAMHGPIEPKAVVENPTKTVEQIDFDVQVNRLMEAQYKSATKGMVRSNQGSLERETHGKDITFSGVQKRKKSKKSVSESWSYAGETSSVKRFVYRLNEALEGMATAGDTQAPDIFQKFADALSSVGQRVGVGPIQDKLKEQGIKWKKSDDGQDIILFVVNDKTKAQQPIARISAETISKPNEFEEALLNMIDLSQGQEPGAFESYRTKMQEQEKAVREVARSLVAPEQQQQAMATTAQAAMPKPASVAAPSV